MNKNWFTYDIDTDFEYYATEAEALIAADKLIALYKEEDFWCEDACEVRVGQITYRSTETNKETRPDEDSIDEDGYSVNSDLRWPEGMDARCDYKMLPFKNE